MGQARFQGGFTALRSSEQIIGKGQSNRPRPSVRILPCLGARVAPQRCPILRAGAQIMARIGAFEIVRDRKMLAAIEKLMLHGIPANRRGTREGSAMFVSYGLFSPWTCFYHIPPSDNQKLGWA